MSTVSGITVIARDPATGHAREVGLRLCACVITSRALQDALLYWTSTLAPPLEAVPDTVVVHAHLWMLNTFLLIWTTLCPN